MTLSEITKENLNAAVKALATKDRSAAVAILARFDALNTAELQPEAWRAVFEACEEARAKIASAP
jgi:hypothetical protein